jgi:hypothetical protein
MVTIIYWTSVRVEEQVSGGPIELFGRIIPRKAFGFPSTVSLRVEDQIRGVHRPDFIRLPTTTSNIPLHLEVYTTKAIGENREQSREYSL